MTTQDGQNRQRIGGRYELGELLGRGGMADVRKATDLRLGRVVAVKRLRTDLASDPTFQARFRREAQSAASLNHPSIAAVYDTGEQMSTDGTDVAQPYIVMEYVAGRTLRDILREGRKILPERALEITSGVLAALDYSHRAGIVHRDIKPANVMLTPAGDVKVMDFGIARAVADSSSTMTQTAAVVGTAQYLSPEQARGENVDSRSDVYSTGCLLYELLTGRPPFVGESPVSVAYQHVREHAAPPSTLDPDLSPGIDAIVMKALAKPVEERYQSAAAMRSDIERYLAGKPVTAPPPPPEDPTSVIPAALPTQPTTMFGGAPDEKERKSRWPLILLALVVLLLLAAAAIFGPKLLSSAPQQKSVPSLQLMTKPEVVAALRDAGLTLGTIDREASQDVAKNKVMSQSPNPNELVDPGSKVDITLSTGKPDVIVPYVIGDTKEEAKTKIEERNLKVKFEEQESDEDAGTVVDTDPKPADSVSTGTVITVFYSSGPTQVPNVVGMTEGKATAKLEDAGFQVSVEEDPDTRAKKGTVLAQDPPPSTPLPQDSTVVITVSTYEEPIETPSDTPSVTPSETPSGTPSETPSGTPSSPSTEPTP